MIDFGLRTAPTGAHSSLRRGGLLSDWSASADLVPLIILSGCLAALAMGVYEGSALAAVSVTAIVAVILLVVAEARLRLGGDLSFVLLIPVVISAAQNVYLSLVSKQADAGSLQFVIIVNFVFAAAIAGRWAIARRVLRTGVGLEFRVLGLLGVLLAYGAVVSLAFHSNLVAAAASARDAVAPLLFLFIGLCSGGRAALSTVARYIVWLGLLSIAFGVVELVVPNFWQSIGLSQLWPKKHIPINPVTDLPSNFYASEQLDGNFIRRMVGPFADPVNFGTFLFAVFMCSWYRGQRARSGVVLAAFVLTVSKGAVLGLLVFVVVWTRFYAPRWVHWIAWGAVGGGAIAFYSFTLTDSTGSTTAHIGGFIAGLVELPTHPLGRGFGDIGVLAGLLDGGASASSNITESGIGMISGSVGVVGLLVYVAFYWWSSGSLRSVGRREQVLGYSLLFGFALNSAFNEVALSPNSCACYFLVLGVIISSRRELTAGGLAAQLPLAERGRFSA